MIQKSSSKAWEGRAKALGFTAATAPGYQGSADIKLSAIPSLTNQTGYSFSSMRYGYSPIQWEVQYRNFPSICHSLGDWIENPFIKTEEWGEWQFLPNRNLLSKNKPHTQKIISPWWLWLKDMWSCSENIELRIQSKWGKIKFVKVYTSQEKYKKENVFNNMASSLY